MALLDTCTKLNSLFASLQKDSIFQMDCRKIEQIGRERPCIYTIACDTVALDPEKLLYHLDNHTFCNQCVCSTIDTCYLADLERLEIVHVMG